MVSADPLRTLYCEIRTPCAFSSMTDRLRQNGETGVPIRGPIGWLESRAHDGGTSEGLEMVPETIALDPRYRTECGIES